MAEILLRCLVAAFALLAFYLLATAWLCDRAERDVYGRHVERINRQGGEGWE
jgi:hypothetical protein